MGLTVFPFCRRFFRCGYISPGAGRRRLFCKDIMEISLVHNVGEITPRTGQAAVRGGAPMAYRAVADAEHAADQGSPGGKAGGVRAVILVKADALRADLVHVGGGIPVVAVAAHMVRPQGVDVDKQDAHKTIPFSLYRHMPRFHTIRTRSIWRLIFKMQLCSRFQRPKGSRLPPVGLPRLIPVFWLRYPES